MILPTFFVAGAPKAGTNALISALATHPDIFVPTDLKEPMFFFWHGCDVEYRFFGQPPIAHDHHRNIDAYSKVFSAGGSARVIGEGSVHYFASERAATNIHSMVPEPRFILLLRDPVERALSHYRFNVMRGLESRSFDAAVEDELADGTETLYPTYRYVGNGLYGRHLATYLSLFPAESILALTYDDLVADKRSVITRAERFLGVREGASDVEAGFGNATVSGGRLMKVTSYLRNSDGWLGQQARRLEATGGGHRLYRVVKQRVKVIARRSGTKPAPAPELPDDLRRRLEGLFGPDLEELARLSGTDVSRWQTVQPDVAKAS
jgi:hypothetical protein